MAQGFLQGTDPEQAVAVAVHEAMAAGYDTDAITGACLAALDQVVEGLQAQATSITETSRKD